MAVVIVGNRLPLALEVVDGAPRLIPSAGGLATGLAGLHASGDGWWVGWPGDAGALTDEARAAIERELRTRRAIPVWLGPEERCGHYDGFANSVLWPLFHDQPERIVARRADAEAWLRVNARFAETVSGCLGEDDVAWVHDYQLAAVPELLRERRPDATIGYFLHIPFPGAEALRALPGRGRVLHGMLGADLVGFHTAASARHFLEACAGVLTLPVRGDRVRVGEREVVVGVFPMGVDAQAWGELGAGADIRAGARRLRGSGAPLFVGIDRLDYTKGIPRRLLAVDALLERAPSLRGRARLLQVGVPTRATVSGYRELRGEVEQLAGRINGRWATAEWSPVQLLLRSLSPEQVAACYLAADVMLVTPVRDGMNLVAKEFCATRTDEDGVLVLSELAGAARELDEALHVNPYARDEVVDAMLRAVTMSREERVARMRRLRARVRHDDVHAWAGAFLEALAAAHRRGVSPQAELARSSPVALEELAHADRLVLLLDWDGTLTPLVADPVDARPDEEVRSLLRALASVAEVHLVSGRHRAQLGAWFGDLAIGLHAEHGLAWRTADAMGWCEAAVDTSWLPAIRERMRRVVEACPGTSLEDKPAGVALHWRAAPRWERHVRAAMRAWTLSPRAPWEILEGSCVMEVRPRGFGKACVPDRVGLAGARVLALGDDVTDAELFAALPQGSRRVQVGEGRPFAEERLADWRAARTLLQALLEQRRGLVSA